MLFFFGYWTSMGMEIFRADVVFFWLLDFYGYGNFQKKMLFFFGYWTSMGMEIFQKNVAFFWLLDFYGYRNFPKKCCVTYKEKALY